MDESVRITEMARQSIEQPEAPVDVVLSGSVCRNRGSMRDEPEISEMDRPRQTFLN